MESNVRFLNFLPIPFQNNSWRPVETLGVHWKKRLKGTRLGYLAPGSIPFSALVHRLIAMGHY